MLGLVSDHAVFFPIEYGLCIEFWNTGALGVSFSAAFNERVRRGMFRPEQVGTRKRYTYARAQEVLKMPHLLDLQTKS